MAQTTRDDKSLTNMVLLEGCAIIKRRTTCQANVEDACYDLERCTPSYTCDLPCEFKMPNLQRCHENRYRNPRNPCRCATTSLKLWTKPALGSDSMRKFQFSPNSCNSHWQHINWIVPQSWFRSRSNKMATLVVLCSCCPTAVFVQGSDAVETSGSAPSCLTYCHLSVLCGRTVLLHR